MIRVCSSQSEMSVVTFDFEDPLLTDVYFLQNDLNFQRKTILEISFDLENDLYALTCDVFSSNPRHTIKGKEGEESEKDERKL